ncbi:RECK [Cordylochernes scorpioides]|uniref:RECK n=1 Tax=Cordylochernes scorpioides TaxID=51811 RepID=A0ABY6L578_9ARAC|nr:RECK [Cordylochernes scorpioides]
MKNRLDKAKNLFSMIRVGRLSDIVWTDEKIFTVEVAHNSQNHHQLLPPENKASRKRRMQTRLKLPKSVMVWAGVTSEGKTPLVFFDQNFKLDSQVYQDIILRDFNDSLLPAAFSWVLGQRHVAFKLPGSKPDGLLRKALQREWAKIDVKYPTVESITKHLQTSIKVKEIHRSGSPVTATDNAAVAAVRNVVEADRRVTIDEIMIRLPPGIEIRRSSIGTIMSDVLNFLKVCTRWVQRMEAARAFLEMHQRDGDQLFSSIVTGDESSVHHSTPETKRQSMVWKKPEESAPKKAKSPQQQSGATEHRHRIEHTAVVEDGRPQVESGADDLLIVDAEGVDNHLPKEKKYPPVHTPGDEEEPGDITSPCKPNPCNGSQVCVVNRNCQRGYHCRPYTCVPGCRLGDKSKVVVPANSYLRTLSPTKANCQKVCKCNHRGETEDCMTFACNTNSENCWVDGRKIMHNSKFQRDCNICFCYDGSVTCTKKTCGSPKKKSALPCSCVDHYVPVCGANGKTYPSACLANRCIPVASSVGLPLAASNSFFSDNVLGIPMINLNLEPATNLTRVAPILAILMTISATRAASNMTVVRILYCKRLCRFFTCCVAVNLQLPCNQHPKFPVCDSDNMEHNNICAMLQRRKLLSHHGKCMQHCRNNGPVCGHNGETYASECAAWAERVSVDYGGSCVTVGSTDGTASSRCNGVKCLPLTSVHCPRVFPPGACCPICGAVLLLLPNLAAADSAVDVLRENSPVVVQTIAEALRTKVTVSDCDVYAHLSLESDVVVTVACVADRPTKLQVQACLREADKLRVMVESRSPHLTAELPLSFLVSAVAVEPASKASALFFSWPALLISALLALMLFVPFLHRLHSWLSCSSPHFYTDFTPGSHDGVPLALRPISTPTSLLALMVVYH